MYAYILNLSCTAFSFLIIAIILISKKYTFNNKVILFLLVNIILSRIIILIETPFFDLSLNIKGSQFSIFGEAIQSIYTILVPSVNFSYVVYLSEDRKKALKYFYKIFALLSATLFIESLIINELNFPITFVAMFSIWMFILYNVTGSLRLESVKYTLVFIYFFLINIFGITIIALYAVLVAFKLETKNQMMIFKEYQLLSDFMWLIFLIYILLNLEIILKSKNEFKFKNTLEEFEILQLLFLRNVDILSNKESEIIKKISIIEKNVINGLEKLNVFDSIYSLSEKINVKTYYLKNIFNKCSSTYGEYKNRISIKRSELLIKEGYLLNKSVEQLSSEVGFNNRVTFYKNFKKYTGKNPTSIKKNLE